MKIRKKTLVIILFLMINSLLFAQKDNAPITAGFYKNIDSKVLNENRQLLIKLPKGYEESTLSYPVVYLLYANYEEQYFLDVVSTLYRLGNGSSTPQFLLVGIGNTDRYRDLLPELNKDTPSGISNFTKFLDEELFPFVEENYRIKPNKILVGPQAGANFGLYTLFTNPNMFDAYIITNPFRWQGGREKLFSNIENYLSRNKSLNKFLFITHDDDDKLEREGNNYIEKFKGIINNYKPKDFRVTYNFLEEGYDFISPLGLKKGLKTLFTNYWLPENHNLITLSDFKNYYKNLSKEIGFELDLPELQLTLHCDKLIKEEKYNSAIEFLDFNKTHFPHKPNAFWRLGDIYFKQGRYKEALENFKVVKDMYPKMNIVDNKIAETEKLIKQQE